MYGSTSYAEASTASAASPLALRAAICANEPASELCAHCAVSNISSPCIQLIGKALAEPGEAVCSALQDRLELRSPLHQRLLSDVAAASFALGSATAYFAALRGWDADACAHVRIVGTQSWRVVYAIKAAEHRWHFA